MRFIMLTYEQLHGILYHDPELGTFIWKPRDRNFFKTETDYYRWNSRYAHTEALTSMNPEGYYRGKILGSYVKAHRIMWQMEYDEIPDIVDHIDGIRTNNMISNLRNVSTSVNNKNMKIPKTNSSGVVGVSFNKGKWRSRIYVNSSEIYLGSFDLIEDAIEERKKAEKLYGYHENHGKR